MSTNELENYGSGSQSSTPSKTHQAAEHTGENELVETGGTVSHTKAVIRTEFLDGTQVYTEEAEILDNNSNINNNLIYDEKNLGYVIKTNELATKNEIRRLENQFDDKIKNVIFEFRNWLFGFLLIVVSLISIFILYTIY